MTTTAVGRSIPPQRLINVVNPLVRSVLQSPLHKAMDSAVLVLHITGRKSGRGYNIPVGYVDIDGKLFVVTQHKWRVNLRGGINLEVTHHGQRRMMHCDLDEDPTSVADTLHELIERIGWKAAQRQFGLKIPGGRTPSSVELEATVREFNLASLTLAAQ